MNFLHIMQSSYGENVSQDRYSVVESFPDGYE